MKKTYRLENLGCAHCAGKMEDAIRKIDGVKNAEIHFLMQKLTLEADSDQFDDIIGKAAKLCKKIEPDCKIIL